MDEDWPEEITIVKFADGSLSVKSEESEKYVRSLFDNNEIKPDNIELTNKELSIIENNISKIDDQELRSSPGNYTGWRKLANKISAIKD